MTKAIVRLGILLILVGNAALNQYSTLTLISDGTRWGEIARAINS